VAKVALVVVLGAVLLVRLLSLIVCKKYKKVGLKSDSPAAAANVS
jgi:hypothetical protein